MPMMFDVGGEVVERECPVGGSVRIEGKKGDVFTVVDTRVRGVSVQLVKQGRPGSSSTR
jgi:hypothetical protein